LYSGRKKKLKMKTMVAYGASDVSWYDVAHEECAQDFHSRGKREYGGDWKGRFRPDVVIPENCRVPCGFCTKETREGSLAYLIAMVDAGHYRIESLTHWFGVFPELKEHYGL
jgi:hypothetical protein